jgi:RHS repeat-associated protein/uncharacterized repeat protein (TIGR01451 family)
MIRDSRRWMRTVTPVTTATALRRVASRKHFARECVRLLAAAVWLLLIPAKSPSQCTDLTSDNPSSLPAGSGSTFVNVGGTGINPATVQLVLGSSPNTVTGGTPVDTTGISSTQAEAFIPSTLLTTPGTFFLTNVPLAGCLASSVPFTVTGTAVQPPQIAKRFGAQTIPLGGTTTLTFAILNPPGNSTLTGVGFVDTLPAGLEVVPGSEQGSCGGGTITIFTVGGVVGAPSVVSLHGAFLQGGESCTFSVLVKGVALGGMTNTTGDVFSNQAVGGTASAPLTVKAKEGFSNTKGYVPVGPFSVGDYSHSGSFTLKANPNYRPDVPTNQSYMDVMGVTRLEMKEFPGDLIDVSRQIMQPREPVDYFHKQAKLPATVLSQTVLVPWTHNFTAHMVNEARVSFDRLSVEFGSGCVPSRQPTASRRSIPAYLLPYVEQDTIFKVQRGQLGHFVFGSTITNPLGASTGSSIVPNVEPTLRDPHDFSSSEVWSVDGVVMVISDLREAHELTAAEEDMINTSDGSLSFVAPHVGIPGSAGSLPQTVTYNSADAEDDPALGFGWRHAYDMSFTPLNPGQLLITFADGTQYTFNCPTSGPGACTPVQPEVFHFRVSALADGSVQVQKTGLDAKVWHLNASGRLDSIGFPTPSQTLTYDASGNLTSVNDTSGRSLQFTNDASGHITSVTDSLARIYRYAYDAAGNLIQITDPLGNNTQFAYDASHHITQVTDPKGGLALRATYDSQGRVTQVQDALGFTQTFAYAPGVTTITDALGHTTKHLYDGSGRLTTIVDASGNSTGFTRDANDLLTSLTDARGNTWNFTYDADGNMTGTTDPLGKTASQTFDANDNALAFTDKLGRTTALTYDANNDVTQAKYADGNSDSFTYAAPHQVATWTNANGGVTTFTHSAAGDLTKVTDALGNNSTFSYDAAGRLLQATDPLGHATAIAYNALDRVTSVTDPLGDKTQFSYDANQNLISGTDADGNASSYAYDARNALVSGTDPLGGSTTVSYDGDGNVLSETDAAGHATAFTYDALNRRTKSTDPLGNTNVFAYDADGDLTQGTDADGKSTQMTYDALNRPTNVQLADGSNIQFTYDAVGNLLSMMDSRGLNAYMYDSRNRLISAATPNGATLGLGRDAVGNTVSTSLPNGQIDHYAYDALNRLQRATDGSGASSTYAYDAASRVTSVALANGASTTFAYDNADRLTNVTNSFGTKLLSSFSYVFDAVGRRLQVTSGAGGTTKYTYDKDGRLVSWTAPSGQTSTYSYDAVGNRTSLTTPAGVTNYHYDAANRQTGAGAAVLSYDAAGNLLTDGTFTYSYDARNQLVSVTGGGVNAQYQYDGFRRRVRQQVGSGVYQYFDDPITGQVLTEAGPDGNLVYFFGGGRISVTGGASPFYYQYDGTGNVATVTDNLGNVKMNYNYDPWGKFLGVFDLLGTKNKYKFAGEATDPGTGLIYMRGEYYNPKVGRFISGGGLVSPGNLYLYQGSNPVQ